MRRPSRFGRWTVTALCGLLTAGCVAQVGDTESVAAGEHAAETGPSREVNEGETAPKPEEPSGFGYDWAEDAIETVTESGVTFSVPGDWTEVPPESLNDSEEAVLLREEGQNRYGEVGVVNGGAAHALPGEGVDAYLEFIAGSAASPEVEVVEDAVPAEIPGAGDAVRTNYTYAIPGGDGAQAHGYILGFTLPTGEVVLFVVSGDGVHVSEELSEQIVSTVRVGAPDDAT